jgi:hypothetical protein
MSFVHSHALMISASLTQFAHKSHIRLPAFIPVNAAEASAKLETCSFVNGPFFPELGSDTTPMTLALQEHLANLRYSASAPPYVFPADMPVFHPNRGSFHATIAKAQMEKQQRAELKHFNETAQQQRAGDHALSASDSSASLLSASSSTASLLSSTSSSAISAKDFSHELKNKDDFTYGQTKGTWQRPYFVPSIENDANKTMAASQSAASLNGTKRPSRRLDASLSSSASAASLHGRGGKSATTTGDSMDMFVPSLNRNAATAPASSASSSAQSHQLGASSSSPALSLTQLSQSQSQSRIGLNRTASSASMRSTLPDPDTAAPVTLGSVEQLVPWPRQGSGALYHPLPVTGAVPLAPNSDEPQPWKPYRAPPPAKGACKEGITASDHPHHHHHRSQPVHKLYPMAVQHQSGTSGIEWAVSNGTRYLWLVFKSKVNFLSQPYNFCSLDSSHCPRHPGRHCRHGAHAHRHALARRAAADGRGRRNGAAEIGQGAERGVGRRGERVGAPRQDGRHRGGAEVRVRVRHEWQSETRNS